MPNIHELLDEAKNRCDTLTEEIEAYRSARSVNNALADSLTSMSEALESTVKKVQTFPIRESFEIFLSCMD
jgi:hypothetical protein